MEERLHSTKPKSCVAKTKIKLRALKHACQPFGILKAFLSSLSQSCENVPQKPRIPPFMIKSLNWTIHICIYRSSVLDTTALRATVKHLVSVTMDNDKNGVTNGIKTFASRPQLIFLAIYSQTSVNKKASCHDKDIENKLVLSKKGQRYFIVHKLYTRFKFKTAEYIKI